jgi:hypothetical protein
MKIDYVNHAIFMSHITLNSHNTAINISQSLCNSTQTHPNGKELVENQSLVDYFHLTCVRSGLFTSYLLGWNVHQSFHCG